MFSVDAWKEHVKSMKIIQKDPFFSCINKEIEPFHQVKEACGHRARLMKTIHPNKDCVGAAIQQLDKKHKCGSLLEKDVTQEDLRQKCRQFLQLKYPYIVPKYIRGHMRYRNQLIIFCKKI